MSSKPSVNLTLFEPVVYLRGQSATGQDSRGRRRQVNFDAPPSQLRGLLTLHLPKPSKIKNISITLNGIARTDWPEGIGTNRLELAEETPIIKQTITLFNAKTDSENQLINGGRKRSNSVGPGIGLNDDVDWDLVPNRNRSNSPATLTNGSANLPSSTNSNKSSTSRRSISRDNSNDFGDHHNPSNASNLARSIGNAAARASSAILPPSIRGEVIGSSKAKEREREEKRALHFQQQQQELEKRNKEKNHPTFKNGTFDSFRNPRASTSPSPPGIVSPNHSIHSGHTVSPNASRPNSRNGSPSSSRLPFGKNKDKIKVAPPPREHFQSNLAPSAAAASSSTSSSSTTSKSAMKKREVETTSSDQKNANQNEAPPDYSYYSSNSPDTSSFISQTNTAQSAPLAERKGFDWNQKTSDELRRPLASSPLSSIPNTPDGSQVATSWMNSTTTSTSTSSSGVDSPMSFSNASSTLFNTRSNESAGSAGAASERSSGDDLVERSGSANVGVPETVRDAGPGGKSILHHNRQESHSVEGAKPGVRFDSNAVESSSPSISNDTGLTSTSLPASPATNRSSQFASSSPSFPQTQFASTPSSTTASAANSTSNSPVGSTMFQPSAPATKTKKTGFKGLISGAGNKDKEKESSASNSNSASKDNRDGSKSSEASVESEWKEFKKGTYTYPICIPLPSNLPPTLHSDFGSNAYILKAFVHRHGALTPNLITEREVTLVHAPDEDGMEESDAIVVERNWEDALSYMVVLYGKSFPVGGKIPIWCKFVPLDKVRIHKIVATIEEKTDYFAKGRRVARHEIPRRWTVLRLANADSNEPLLPIISDASDALSSSPLTPLAQAASGSLTEETDLVPSLMDPTGPWELYTDLVVPTASGTRINISTNHQRSNIAVHHLVRLSIRVEKVQDSSKDKKKLFDIIIEVPLSLTHSRTAETLTRLPDYWNLANEEESQDTSSNDASNGSRLSNGNTNHSSSSQRSRSLAPSSSLPRPPPPPPTVSSLLSAPSSQRSPSESLRFTRDPQDPVAAASNPLELSRRWLALSVNPNQPGNSANSNAPNGSNVGAGPTVDPRGSDWAEHEEAENASNPPPSYQDTTNNNPRARNPYNSGVVGGVSSWGVSEA